jgi:hypothetical protein
MWGLRAPLQFEHALSASGAVHSVVLCISPQRAQVSWIELQVAATWSVPISWHFTQRVGSDSSFLPQIRWPSTKMPFFRTRFATDASAKPKIAWAVRCPCRLRAGGLM